VTHSEVGPYPISNRDFDPLVQEDAVIRNVERERRYFNVEPLAVCRLHLIGPAHHSRWRVERSATRVLKAFSWLENRLLSDNTWSFNLSQLATRIPDSDSRWSLDRPRNTANYQERTSTRGRMAQRSPLCRAWLPYRVSDCSCRKFRSSQLLFRYGRITGDCHFEIKNFPGSQLATIHPRKQKIYRIARLGEAE